MALAWPMTPKAPADPRTAEEIRHLWETGHQFKVYQKSLYVDNTMIVRMKMSGVTSIKLFYKDKDERPQFVEVAL